ncbi:hypothetical protein WS96_24880 [Burkholderia sp. MSMB1835]|nr:hypothetical protein WS96_24880 [Burkholderia sp. MSMB1835]
MSRRDEGHATKRSKSTEEQIAFALTLAELGTTIEEICRKLGISDATFDDWKKKFGGPGRTTGATQPSRKFSLPTGTESGSESNAERLGSDIDNRQSGNEKRC